MVKTEQIQVKTKGNCHVVDITDEAGRAVAGSGLKAGVITLFHVGSTAGLTTTDKTYKTHDRRTGGGARTAASGILGDECADFA